MKHYHSYIIFSPILNFSFSFFLGLFFSLFYFILYIRYGLAQHHWGDVDNAKKNFELAKVAAGLTTQLTGFNGRKTKYQSFDTQHLVVIAHSELDEVHAPYIAPKLNVPAPLPLLPEEKENATRKADHEALGMGSANNTTNKTNQTSETNKTNDTNDTNDTNETNETNETDETRQIQEAKQNTVTNDKTEMLKKDADDMEKLIQDPDTPEAWTENQHAQETRTGVKEYTLDELDVDNIVFERIRFTDENYQDGGAITLFDQCILLALCLDVKNSNPKHGLTKIEMEPYVTRVMDGSANMNWMVHTSALVVRAWLEFEVWRTKTRAVMQLQALVDQHDNRLTAGQQAGTDSYAPPSQRMRYVYTLPLPSSWEMRSDLADRYMSLHVKHSALRLYEDLEKWEQVVQCYLDLERDVDAKNLVKERLEGKRRPQNVVCNYHSSSFFIVSFLF